MRHENIDKLIKYFSNIKDRTEEENSFIKLLQEEKEYFSITSLHRQDILKIGFNAKKFNDANMRYLANEMEYAYLENSYWSSLELACEKLEGIEVEEVL